MTEATQDTGYDPGPAFRAGEAFGVQRRSGPHPGQDWPADQGTAIPAAAEGTVWYSGRNASYGNVVILRHVTASGGEFFTLYAHMTGLQMPRLGEAITVGQNIGQVGNTGMSFGAHLHFEVILGARPSNAAGGSLGLTEGVGRVDPSRFDGWRSPPFNPFPLRRRPR